MRGLANVGNTCGVNTLIQCIGHVTYLREWLIANETIMAEESLGRELATILRMQWKEEHTIIPRRFMQIFYNKLPFFVHGEQHDLYELWMMLFDCIGKENHNLNHILKYVPPQHLLDLFKKDDMAYHNMIIKASTDVKGHNREHACEWTDIIQGVQISQIECTNCDAILQNFEPWAALSVEVPASHNIATSLEKYMQRTYIDDWRCDKCQVKEKAKQTVRFWKLPKVLIITLKRFEYNPQKNSMIKINNPVDIPESMQFFKPHVFGIESRTYIAENNGKMDYHLCSLGLHHGNANGGHYTAIARVKDENWVHYDDVSLAKLSSNDFLKNNSAVYMLIYELK